MYSGKTVVNVAQIVGLHTYGLDCFRSVGLSLFLNFILSDALVSMCFLGDSFIVGIFLVSSGSNLSSPWFSYSGFIPK